jgi:hypothetical protein
MISGRTGWSTNDLQLRELLGLAIRGVVSYAGGMRYGEGGGLDAAERARRERVRLAAAEMLDAGQAIYDSEDVSRANKAVSRNDAVAAAYQLAGFIAATSDPRVVPDPGAGAAHLMILMEYIAPQPADLELGFKDALQTMVTALQASGA